MDEALLTTMQIELINKKKFAKTALDENSKTVVHMASFNLALKIHLDKKAQIFFLIIKKVKILDKYSAFTNVFSEKKALILLERSKLNEHTIDLEDGKQLFY